MNRLNEVRQDHLKSTEILQAHCHELHKGSDSRMQTAVLFGIVKQMLERKERSRAALGRHWELDDLDTGALPWTFTEPLEKCMVPFHQSMALEDQKQVLAQTCRLIVSTPIDFLDGAHSLAS